MNNRERARLSMLVLAVLEMKAHGVHHIGYRHRAERCQENQNQTVMSENSYHMTIDYQLS